MVSRSRPISTRPSGADEYRKRGRVNASAEAATVQLTIDDATLEGIAERVADLLEVRRDEGFLDVDGAAEFLGLSRKAVYHLVERRKLPHHRAGGRLLFERAELRRWVERG